MSGLRKWPPFRVEGDGPGWTLVMRHNNRRIIWCETQGECFDHAYRNWPRWP